MPIITGDAEQVRQMRLIVGMVEDALAASGQQVEPALVAMALCQIARTTLRWYPQEIEAQLLGALVAFFRNAPPDEESPIILPKGFLQ
jgi:hypothetical protein